jgi:hypothetical protein
MKALLEVVTLEAGVQIPVHYSPMLLVRLTYLHDAVLSLFLYLNPTS